MAKKIDLTGKRFGRLVVLYGTDERVNGSVVHLCKCDCGNDYKTITARLNYGAVKSCGCMEVENRNNLGARTKITSRKHGQWGTNTYKSWIGLRCRCNDKLNADYGGRGVTYPREWDSFESFLSDMGHCPIGSSIERIDNSLGYSKENCKWATPKQQTRNRRSSSFVSHKGIIMTMAEYSEAVNMSWSGAYKRANREGIFMGKKNENGIFVKEAS